MTPERALLERMRERLDCIVDDTPSKRSYVYRQCAMDLLAWLTAEMAKLERGET